MALYKKEVLVRPNSSADFEAAMNFSINWLTNTFQEKEDNKDEDGNYIDYFFADVFFAPGHANGGQVWRIYSTPCQQKYGLAPAESGRIEFMINDLLGTQDRLEELSDENDQQDQLLAAYGNTLEDHTSRIEALEEANDEVTATVI